MSEPTNEVDYDVIVVGAGPVGLTTTIDLGRRGVKCLLMEQDPSTAPWPKMDRSNARSMEIFRRLGLADRVRELGYPADNSMDVILATALNEPPVAVLPYPTVAQRRAEIAECHDGTLPLEPYQLVSQNALEPLLRQVAENETPNTTLRYGLELVTFEQDKGGVTIIARGVDGSEEQIRTKYLVGCDGGASTTRKHLGIKLRGRGGIKNITQVVFWAEDLYERMEVGKGRHYHFVGVDCGLVVQGNRKEMSISSGLPPETDFNALLRGLIGPDYEFEIRHQNTWRHHLLLADKYRDGRVFLAGDAAHLVIPTGGLGMNTGLGDAIDLAWKLAGAVHGWGGEALLDSYENERRPVGQRNIEASGWAADGAGSWRIQAENYTEDPTPENREALAAAFVAGQARMHGMVGAETCYSYAGSPIVAHEAGNRPFWSFNEITPHGRPGIRIPHVWLSNGNALHDGLGYDYTLLDLTGSADTSPFEVAFKTAGAELSVLAIDEPAIRELLNGSVFLIRPDLHIAWRGDVVPEDVTELVKIATGNGPTFRP